MDPLLTALRLRLHGGGRPARASRSRSVNVRRNRATHILVNTRADDRLNCRVQGGASESYLGSLLLSYLEVGPTQIRLREPVHPYPSTSYCTYFLPAAQSRGKIGAPGGQAVLMTLRRLWAVKHRVHRVFIRMVWV